MMRPETMIKHLLNNREKLRGELDRVNNTLAALGYKEPEPVAFVGGTVLTSAVIEGGEADELKPFD